MVPTPPPEPQVPRVSVIFVTYNQGGALRRAVAALQSETVEILVADCASLDDSARIDIEFPRVNVLRLPHHVGAARAMNIATRTAKADLVLYLSPDVEIDLGAVTALADRLEASPEDIAVCPLLVDEQGRPAPHCHALPDAATLAAAARGGALPPAAIDMSQESVAVGYASAEALLVRKAFVRGMNFFDQRYGHYWADLDLAMQIRRAAKKIHLYPSIRATRHAAADPTAAEPIAAADRILGAAAFLGKYGMGGTGLRISATLSALAGFKFGLFSALLGGQKLDGTQTGA